MIVVLIIVEAWNYNLSSSYGHRPVFKLKRKLLVPPSKNSPSHGKSLRWRNWSITSQILLHMEKNWDDVPDRLSVKFYCRWKKIEMTYLIDYQSNSPAHGKIWDDVGLPDRLSVKFSCTWENLRWRRPTWSIISQILLHMEKIWDDVGLPDRLSVKFSCTWETFEMT